MNAEMNTSKCFQDHLLQNASEIRGSFENIEKFISSQKLVNNYPMIQNFDFILKRNKIESLEINHNIRREDVNSLTSNESIFNPLSCITYLEKEKKICISTLKFDDMKSFEIFLSNQNLSKRLGNILSEQYLIKAQSPLKNHNENKSLNLEKQLSNSSSIRTSSSSSNFQLAPFSDDEINVDIEVDRNKNLFLNRKRVITIDTAHSQLRPKKRNKIQRAAELLEDSFIKDLPEKDNIVLNNLNLTKTKSIIEIYTIESFKEDLSRINDDPAHNFMKANFPIMYTHENYFKFHKLLEEKRKKLNENDYSCSKNIYSNYSMFDYNCNYSSPKRNTNYTTCNSLSAKRLWAPRDNGESLINNFLNKVEKAWPYEKYSYSQEYALQFLMKNEYSYDKTYDLIELSHPDFEIFMKEKLSGEISSPNLTNHEQVGVIKKKYSFRNKY